MSDLRVTIERLTIHEHPNADALELAQVGLYRAVVPKGVYETGDYALYIPEQAVLPPELIEELGLTGRLAGPEKNRVKATRLRGELSQGIVCRPKVVGHLWRDSERQQNALRIMAGTDFAEDLGITKWVPPIPVDMAGEVESAPDLLRWIDIENVKRYPDIFEPGEQVIATEKIHGTCCLYTLTADGGEYVSSKGFGGKSLALKPSETNLYWRAVRQHKLRQAAQEILERYDIRAVGFFGEVYGKGVQDLHYGMDAGRDEAIGYALFDAATVSAQGQHWVGQEFMHLLVQMYGIPSAPVVYVGPYDYELLAQRAEGKSILDPETIREGLVVRPMTERYSDVLGGRAIGKIVSEAYLLRKGATEFE